MRGHRASANRFTMQRAPVASTVRLHYASSMIRLALIAFFLIPGMAHAVICKTVDADGVVGYTDVPARECKAPVKLPPNSTYEPRQLPASIPGKEAVEAGDKVGFQGYQSMRIVQPEADGTVRSNEGKVPVTIALEPELHRGHRVAVFLDGKAVLGSFDGLAIELSGIERGTHSVRATVSDAKGKRLIESPTIQFTLRKPGLFDGAPNRQPGPRPR